MLIATLGQFGDERAQFIEVKLPKRIIIARKETCFHSFLPVLEEASHKSLQMPHAHHIISTEQTYGAAECGILLHESVDLNQTTDTLDRFLQKFLVALHIAVNNSIVNM